MCKMNENWMAIFVKVSRNLRINRNGDQSHSLILHNYQHLFLDILVY